MDYLEITGLDLETQKNLLSSYKEQLPSLPDLIMVCKNINGKKYYYIVDKHTGKQRVAGADLMLQIQEQHTLKKAIKILERNISLQEKLISGYRPYDLDSIKQLLPKVYRSPPSIPPPVQPSATPSSLPHRTSFGLSVRSKSEALIAELLHAERVPFEYERTIRLNNGTDNILIHPDFTIFTRKEPIYWEHMGMMSVNDYRIKALKKLGLYSSNGITIPDRLIITMDSADGCIDMMAIKMMIKTILALNDVTLI